MLIDIVVDTNVLMHASDPRQADCSEAANLLTALEVSQTSLCMDEGFDIEPSRNRSLIGEEYIRHLHIGMRAYALLVQLANTERISIVSRRVNPAIGKKIKQIIAIPRDRTFIRVAINSQDRFLCSHDITHFPEPNRVKIKRLLNVRVKTAGETLPFIVQTDSVP